MKLNYTDTTEKGLEAHIIQHLCLENGFEERYFNQYNRTDCVDEELLFFEFFNSGGKQYVLN